MRGARRRRTVRCGMPVRDDRYVVPPSMGPLLALLRDLGGPDPRRSGWQGGAMPSKFDEFSARAASRYTGGDPEIARRVTCCKPR